MLRRFGVGLWAALLIPAAAGAQEISAAPIPPAAMGPAIPQDKGYLVEEIRDGLYWVTDGGYQALFATTGEGVIVVDAPPSIGENLLRAIAEVTDEPVRTFIYSHSHKDHVGAANIFPAGTTYIAHEETAAMLAEAQDPARPVPTVTFSDDYVLRMGSQTVELSYKGVNHTPGNAFVYWPGQRVLMLVDVVFPGWVPFKSLALTQNAFGFIAAHDQILAYDFEEFVGGHLTRLGTRADVETARAYAADVQQNAGMALQTVDFMAIAQRTGFANQWLLFQTYLDAVAQACADATVPDWIDRLGGADVFTFSHCWAMQSAFRID